MCRKEDNWIKYDIKEWNFDSEFDPTEYVVNLLTMIQGKYIRGNVREGEVGNNMKWNRFISYGIIWN